MLLQNKKVLITGAGGAIGSELALGFAREGADVALHYRSSSKRVSELVAEIKAMGRDAVAIKADLSMAEEVRYTVDEAVKYFGRLDIAINNAIYGPQIPVLDLSLDEINTTFETNLRGYFLIAQYAAKQMVAQKSRGWIVNISSISSRVVTSSYVHYAATKGGVEALTRGMAVALGRKGINVNCIAPGVVNTPTVKNMFDDPRNADPVIDRTPTGFIAEIADCVAPVIFLCTEGARSINGQVIDVDGGYSIQGMEWVLSDEMVEFRNKLEEKGSDALRENK
jgi:NAD(P)-dependent dehydrogenase (short-subunit alcohol dehydrogenase family)